MSVPQPGDVVMKNCTGCKNKLLPLSHFENGFSQCRKHQQFHQNKKKAAGKKTQQDEEVILTTHLEMASALRETFGSGRSGSEYQGYLDVVELMGNAKDSIHEHAHRRTGTETQQELALKQQCEAIQGFILQQTGWYFIYKDTRKSKATKHAKWQWSLVVRYQCAQRSDLYKDKEKKSSSSRSMTSTGKEKDKEKEKSSTAMTRYPCHGYLTIKFISGKPIAQITISHRPCQQDANGFSCHHPQYIGFLPKMTFAGQQPINSLYHSVYQDWLTKNEDLLPAPAIQDGHGHGHPYHHHNLANDENEVTMDPVDVDVMSAFGADLTGANLTLTGPSILDAAFTTIGGMPTHPDRSYRAIPDPLTSALPSLSTTPSTSSHTYSPPLNQPPFPIPGFNFGPSPAEEEAEILGTLHGIRNFAIQQMGSDQMRKRILSGLKGLKELMVEEEEGLQRAKRRRTGRL